MNEFLINSVTPVHRVNLCSVASLLCFIEDMLCLLCRPGNLGSVRQCLVSLHVNYVLS